MKWNEKISDVDNALTLFGKSIIDKFIQKTEKKGEISHVRQKAPSPNVTKNVSIDNRKVTVYNISGGTNQIIEHQENNYKPKFIGRKRRKQ